MKFLPIEDITYKTKLKEEEVLKRLSDLVEPEKTFMASVFSNSSTKPYEGKIDAKGFSIRRIISYRNSALPVIKGTIEKNYDGISIKVKMRLHIFVMVSIFFYCSIIGLVCISLLRQSFPPPTLIPFGMLLFAYLVIIAGFNFESNKSKKDLQRVFEADIVES